MTGIPSIVAGLFAYALFVLFFGAGVPDGLRRRGRPVAADDPDRGALLARRCSGWCPTTCARRRTPWGCRSGARSSRWCCPTALAGIITGVTLAIARVIGETAPLLVIAGATDSINTNLFDGRMMTLPVFIYYPVHAARRPAESATSRAWGGALVLIVIVMVLNLARPPHRPHLRPQAKGH